MISKEKIRELANKVSFDFSIRDKNIEVITEWLEQNQPSPQVGLSDNDAFNLAAFLRDCCDIPHSIEYIQDDILVWQGGRKVVDPVVVGLSDEQVELLAKFIMKRNVNKSVKEVIEEFLETQTFAQSDGYKEKYTVAEKRVESNMRLVKALQRELVDVGEDFSKLEKEYSRLNNELVRLKSQQFQPNWDDAPVNAEYRSVLMYWFDKNHQRIGEVEKQVFYRPQPPAPKVSVGETWKYKGKHYTLGLMSLVKEGSDWVSGVTYISDDDGSSYTRTLSDFLTKFERVGGSE